VKKGVNEPAGSAEAEKETGRGAPRKRGGDNKAYQKNGNLKTPHFKDKERPMRSHEKGFTGNSEQWFDEEAYNKPK